MFRRLLVLYLIWYIGLAPVGGWAQQTASPSRPSYCQIPLDLADRKNQFCNSQDSGNVIINEGFRDCCESPLRASVIRDCRTGRDLFAGCVTVSDSTVKSRMAASTLYFDVKNGVPSGHRISIPESYVKLPNGQSVLVRQNSMQRDSQVRMSSVFEEAEITYANRARQYQAFARTVARDIADIKRQMSKALGSTPGAVRKHMNSSLAPCKMWSPLV